MNKLTVSEDGMQICKKVSKINLLGERVAESVMVA